MSVAFADGVAVPIWNLNNQIAAAVRSGSALWSRGSADPGRPGAADSSALTADWDPGSAGSGPFGPETEWQDYP